MSVLLKSRVGVLSAALTCLLAGLAFAQQGQTTGQGGASRSPSGDTNQSASGQSDRPSAAQSGRATSQTSEQSAQPSTANYPSAQTGAGGHSQQVEQFLTACLLADNQAEVELSQLAQQQANSPDVKEFAQMMVKDHQNMIQQLQQIANGHASAGQGNNRASNPGSTSSNTDAARNFNTPVTRGAATPSATSNSQVKESVSTDTSRTEASGSRPGSADTRNTSSPSATPTAGDKTGLSRDTSATSLDASETATSSGGGKNAVHELMQIDRQIVDRKTQATREELQQKSGVEFDKCFVGNAITAHVHAMAKLEVIGKQSPGKLGQVAQQAQPTVQQHLDHAKQLMKKLEGQAGSSDSDSARTSTPSER